MTILTTLLVPTAIREGLTGPADTLTHRAKRALARAEDSTDIFLARISSHTGSRQTRYKDLNRRKGARGNHIVPDEYMSPEATKAAAVIVVVDLFLLILAIHYILKCSKARGWGMGMSILLIAMLFIPGFGPIIAISMIIYGLTGGCKPPMSFHFF